jgi:hypothetical protein
MALPINKDIALEIAKKKVKDQIAKKEALNAKKLIDAARNSKTIPKPTGVIDIKSLSKTVNASLPDNQKPKGLAKLGNIITNQGLQLVSAALPAAQTYASQLGIDIASDLIPDLCPSQPTIDSIIIPINNLIENLNSTATFVEDINKLMQDISTGATVVSTTSAILDALIPSLTIAADASPVAPGFLVAAIDKIDYANKKLIFKNDGTPRLPELLTGLGSVTVATSLVSFYVKQIKTVLEKIINLIKKCSPSTNILALNSSVDTLSKQQDQSSANQDNLYKGFLLKIVEVKFNNQLNQRKAVAYNGNGIPTLETELSFTTNTQVLVEELKQIIDNSGLIGDYKPEPQPPTLEQDLLPESETNKDVRLLIIKTRISKVLEKLKNQLGLNAYLRIPPPTIPTSLDLSTLSTFTISVYNWVNQVNQRKEGVSDSAKNTVNKNLPIVLNYLQELQSLITDIEVIEGRVSKVNISTSNNLIINPQ